MPATSPPNPWKLPNEQERAGLQRLLEVAHGVTCGGVATHTDEQLAAIEAADRWAQALLDGMAEKRIYDWEVQNETDGCGGCPAGGWDECLVSPLDARVATPDNYKAPEGCPLRGGAVLLIGEGAGR